MYLKEYAYSKGRGHPAHARHLLRMSNVYTLQSKKFQSQHQRLVRSDGSAN